MRSGEDTLAVLKGDLVMFGGDASSNSVAAFEAQVMFIRKGRNCID